MIGKRLAAFAFVGAMGFLVQLFAFAALTRGGWPYPAATAAAVEAAVLHNFVWYERWTWADRNPRGMTSSAAWRLVRFNISVGGASIAGNVAIVLALVRGCGAPPLAANVLAVAVLGVINFVIADRWIFAGGNRNAAYDV